MGKNRLDKLRSAFSGDYDALKKQITSAQDNLTTVINNINSFQPLELSDIKEKVDGTLIKENAEAIITLINKLLHQIQIKLTTLEVPVDKVAIGT